jgi:hypothetical protein
MLVQWIFGASHGTLGYVVFGLGYVGVMDLWCLSQGSLGYVVLGLGYVGALDLWCLPQGTLCYVVLGLGYVGAFGSLVPLSGNIHMTM